MKRSRCSYRKADGYKKKYPTNKKFSKKNGYRPLKTGILPAKVNPTEQRKFLKNVLRPLISQAKKGKVQLFSWMLLILYRVDSLVNCGAGHAFS